MKWKHFLAGNDEAFSFIYSELVDHLYVYGLRFTYNEELVRDCVQDLFVKLYIDRKKLNPVENVKVYLCASLKNTLFNLFRKEPEHYQIDFIEPVFHLEFNVEDEIIENEYLFEQKKQIEELMQHITPRQREVLYYRFIEELSYEEICVLMKMNYQSVRNLIHRIISKIRITIEHTKTDQTQNKYKNTRKLSL